MDTSGRGATDSLRRGGRGPRPASVLLVGLLLAPLLAGCLTRTSGGTAITRRQDLQKLPEERLVYPGSVVIGSGGADLDRFVAASPNPAFSGHVLGVNASADEVLDFYRRELPARGWQESGVDSIAGTAEVRALGWRKENLVFRVAILRKNDPRNPDAGDAFVTAYDIAVQADPPSR
jgi:hypothetical protein